MPEAILFRQCLGLNDAIAISSQIADPKKGITQLTACSNMTITDDGCIQTVPALSTVLTHTAPITRVSAGQRLFYGDGVDTYELAGSTPVKRFLLLDGPMIHTPLDVRLSGASAVYKSVHPAGAATEALVGANPDQGESIAWAKQPLFGGGFVQGARLFAHKGKYLQYSKAYHYDLWDLGNGFIGHQFDVLQAGAIPGVVLCAHAEGVSVYIGDLLNPQTVKRFYPCAYIAKTLYSGFVSKSAGYGHVFLCDDGVYMVDLEGSINRLTNNDLDRASVLNSSYSGAVVAGGKYLAFGDTCCVECSLIPQVVGQNSKVFPVLLRDSGVASACVLRDTAYLAYGSTLSTIPPSGMAATGNCSFTLPYSHMGAEGRKQFDCLYLTGEFNGDLEITLMDQTNPEEPERWTQVASDLGVVQNRRVKLPKGTVGSKCSLRFSIVGGSMRAEEIRTVFSAGQRR